MPDTKITALAAITTVDPAADVLPIVDISDTSMAASGTTKKITSNQILGAGGTATLASATITGDLTVDTSTLKVDSANNRVGIGTASLFGDFTIQNGSNCRFEVTSSASGISIENLNNARNAYLNMTMYADAYIWNRLGSEAMRLNSTGLGVGGSPVSGMLLTVGSTSSVSATANALQVLSNKGTFNVVTDGSTNAAGTTITYSWANGGQGPLIFRNAAISNVMTLDASGNVGIGVTPSAWYTTGGYRALQIGNASLYGRNSTNSEAYLSANAFENASASPTYITSSFASRYTQDNGVHKWLTAPSGTAGNAITFTQAMTLDASGNLLVGVTSTTTPGVGNTTAGGSLNANGAAFFSHASSQALYLNTNVDGQIVSIRRSNVAVGSISVTTTATAYNTSSDYRLKEAVQPLVGGLARVSALKPSIYKWKTDGSNGEGFIAHELAEVVPFAVTGEKDAVNEDGSIKAQGVDLSKVVPVLVAAIQELAAEVNALKNA